MRLALTARAALLLAAVLGGEAVAREAADVGIRRIDTFSPRPIEGARVGFLGGLVLRGPSRLGALSGLLVEGDRMLAATDTGDWVEARLVLDGERLLGIEDVIIAARIGEDGEPIHSKNEGDAEALALLPGAVAVLVESQRVLLAYPADGLAVDFGAVPRRIDERRLGSSGMEALSTRLDGTLVLIMEGREGVAEETPALVVGGRRFKVRRRDGFAITGSDGLPGGDMVIVERRYRGGLDVAMRIRRIGADALATGGLADGPILLEADFSAEIDNMEAIAAEVRDGEIILTLASDDNHSFPQRTLLLRFRVSDPLPRPKPQGSDAAVR